MPRVFSLRSARGRAALAGAVLIVLLAATTGLSVWRAHNDQQQRARLEHASAAAAALQHARAQFFLEAAAAIAQTLIRDPMLTERYERAATELREDLSRARAELMASGKTDDVAALDAITERIDSIEATIQAGMPILLTGDQEDVLALASAAWPLVWPNVDAAMNELETLAAAQQNEVVADTAAANRATDTTLALLIGLSAAGFLVAAGTVAMLILSVVWPLAALRASARAITSGDLKARAKVRGPEEVASLAHDFNEMTDALATKTKELEVRAITDGLTGLYNHAHFYQRLAEEIERSKRYKRRFAVVMMDVDAFKQYNDSHGHRPGDDALRLIADCIRAGLRRSDLPFRYGGDEFAAILLNADSSRAQTVVNRINRRIATELKKMDDPAAAWLGLSAGVASFPQDGITPDDLVKVADSALYDAKRVAWARAVTGQGPPTESSASPSGLVHETQSVMLSTAASSLATVLQDIGACELAPGLDVRAIATVGAASEIKDVYLHGHQERTSLWAAALAEEMGLPSERVRNIRIASLLHDIGKVSVSERLLNKPGKLTDEEFAEVKQHAPLGAEIIVSEAETLQNLAPIVRHHHEHFGGKGYPDGLTGEQIPLEARILAVADVFDAMTHERAYRKALSREEAIAELERATGTQFDPEVVKAFLALARRRDEEPTASPQAERRDRRLASAKVAASRKG